MIGTQIESSESSEGWVPQVLVRRWLWLLAAATWGLMALGSATRVMEAGLACPDWPLCFGQVLPAQQMDLRVFLEWFHRLVAATVGFGVLLLVGMGWWWRAHLPRWLPWGVTAALGLVLWQGILGGLTVTQLLRFDIVTAHLGTGLAFFSLLLTLAVSLMDLSVALSLPQYLPGLSLVSAVTVYGQSLLGGLVASRWAAHQCFLGRELCQVLHWHLLGLIPAMGLVLVVGVQTLRQKRVAPWLGQLGHGVLVMLIVQIGVGVATYQLRLQVEPLTVTHQAVGALLLGMLVVLTVLLQRVTVPPTQTIC
ncbi:cytochrome oxidase assembly [Gloeomargarita lithophora Alchichica-D10]|uniref:Cytochrome oxidase assembly n=1 Tax=Gloeomargarita lithophora Alchichica-D10 TaxID=1188229 RepID=A0A1J0ADF8_9CYAN|nr:COX15/CtaA family protein [Gloeomargarita lithophora]APB33943.1 cytochrome oxidase assembly [Gloeomargarita lithophora Alchichica-D10]